MKTNASRCFAVAMLASTISPMAAHSATVQYPKARSERVSYADLDLSKAEGRQTLDQRVRAAARRVCNEGGSLDALTMVGASRCRQRTMIRARHDVQLAVLRAGNADQLASR